MTPQPGNASTAIQNACNELQKGNKQAARSWALRAVTMDPGVEDPWLILAALSEPYASLQYIKEALKINPRSPRARQGLQEVQKRLEERSRVEGRQNESGQMPWLQEEAETTPKAALSQTPTLQGEGATEGEMQARQTQEPETPEEPEQEFSASNQPEIELPVEKASDLMPPPSEDPKPLESVPEPNSPDFMQENGTEPPLRAKLEEQSEPMAPELQDILAQQIYREKDPEQRTSQPTNRRFAFTRSTLRKLFTILGLTGLCILILVLILTRNGNAHAHGPFAPDGGASSMALAAAQAAEYTPTPLIITPTPLLPLEEGNQKHIVVSLAQQQLYAYQGTTLVYQFTVTTGTQENTRPGSFTVLDKIDKARSSSFGFWMPDWLGYEDRDGLEIGIHALPETDEGEVLWGEQLGKPGEHACVILNTREAGLLYDWAEIGTKVDIIE
jgi:lipoprotein-anchoring transpeptidase ErfK/SrfK